jgi:2'-5' RNA ligase
VNLNYTIIEKAVKEIIYKVDPFIVNKINIGQSENIWKSLFVNIEKNHELVFMNTELSNLFNEFDKNKFLPHVSLIYKNLSKIEKLETIQKLKIKNKFEIDKISIIKFSKNIDRWEVIQTLNL